MQYSHQQNSNRNHNRNNNNRQPRFNDNQYYNQNNYETNYNYNYNNNNQQKYQRYKKSKKIYKNQQSNGYYNNGQAYETNSHPAHFQEVQDINELSDDLFHSVTLFLPGEIYPKASLNSFDFNKRGLFKHYINENILIKKPNLLLNNIGKENIMTKSLGKIYEPKVNDFVIGTVVQKFSDYYKLDINSTMPGVLQKVKTEGNKNTKLDAEVGELILCRISSININDYCQLSTEKAKKPKDINVHGNLGKLIKGTIFDIPLNKVKLLSRDFELFKNNECSFTVGHNGKLFIMPNDPLSLDKVVQKHQQILKYIQEHSV